jgi:YesN/AraC family two-component response regulator
MKIDLIFSLRIYLDSFNVKLSHVAPPFNELEDIDGGIRRYINPTFNWQEVGKNILAQIQPDTFFLIEDILGAKYAIFEIPDEKEVYIIGPWRGKCRSSEQLLWATSNLGERIAEIADNYYNTIPQVADQNIYIATSAFISQLYPSDNFKFVHLYDSNLSKVDIDHRYFAEPVFLQKRSASMLEQQYEAENSIFEAVKYGNSSGALMAYRQFCSYNTPPVSERSLRQRKTDLIMLNTLLRKAIEQANVHPYYIDSLNSKYLDMIEQITDDSDYDRVVHDIIMDYCSYVHRYSLKQYSPLIQKVINYVNLHLDLPLSLKRLSEMYFISPSYLSALLRQETGTTLTDYINTQRVHRAAQQLVSTNDSVSAIASGVGMLDVNYFSKIFKKALGVTPTQYRRNTKKQS